MPKLVIIDGYSLLYRAFFAPGPYLSTADGRPTGAVFGFTNSLLSVLEQEKPDAIYVAWDSGGATFRHDAFQEYKAHRQKPGEDLRLQIPVARELVRAFGIAAVEAPRFEADDLIGTLATEGVREGYEVVIVTGDTDQLQLVGDGVRVRMVRRGVTDTKLYDVDAVIERYGIPPERVPDYKALVGDPSDNIPGVPGIGDKTATKLLQQYGSLEELLAHVQELPPGKVRDALIEAGDRPLRARELATIHCTVPFEGPIARYEPTPETWAAVRSFFEDLEFRSLLRRLPSPPAREQEALVTAGAGGGLVPFTTEVVRIETEEQLQALLAEAREAGRLAVRVHADSAQPMAAKLAGIAFAASPSRAYYLALGETRLEAPSGGLFGEAQPQSSPAAGLDLLPLRAAVSALRLIAHNAKFEQIVLSRRQVGDFLFSFDTMVAAYLLAPGRSSYPLQDLASEYLRARLGDEESGAGETPPEERLSVEAALLIALEEPMRERLEREGLAQILDQIEMPLVPVLAEMERTGVPVDREWLDRLSVEMKQKMDEVSRRIYELAGEEFAIGSTQQLQRVLFEKLKLPAGRKIKTGYSTGADVLEALAAEHEICSRILEWREVSKLKSTYADALPKLVNPETGRIHTSLNQTVAATGRLSSSEPNLQNIPVRSEIGREIRKAFVAPRGHVLLSCDYSQIELRIFAHITQDPELVRAFQADEDIHAATAMKLYNVPREGVLPEMRRMAKTVNFAVIYGQSDFGLASTLGIGSAEARSFIQAYFEQFPGVRRYTQETLEFARRNGYVRTLLGRKRYLPEINSGNANIRQAAERAAVNMPIQGTAADIMKLAMIQVHRRLKEECFDCALLLQVHDELVFSVRREHLEPLAREVVDRMESAYPLTVRLRVDARTGNNWAEMSPLPI